MSGQITIMLINSNLHTKSMLFIQSTVLLALMGLFTIQYSFAEEQIYDYKLVEKLGRLQMKLVIFDGKKIVIPDDFSNRALQAYEELKEVEKSVQKVYQHQIANAYVDLSNFAVMAEDLSTAELFVRKAIEVYETTGNENILGYKIAYSNLGQILYEKGQFDIALDVLMNSKRLGVDLLKRGQYSGAAFETVLIGEIYEARGDGESANKAYHEALRIIATLGSPGFSTKSGASPTNHIWPPLVKLAKYYNQQGEIDYSIFLLKIAINYIQKDRGFLSKVFKSASIDIAHEKSHYKQLIEMLIDKGRIAEAMEILRMLKEAEYYNYLKQDKAIKYDPRQERATFNANESEANKIFQILFKKPVEDRKTKGTKYVMSEYDKKMSDEFFQRLENIRLLFSRDTNKKISSLSEGDPTQDIKYEYVKGVESKSGIQAAILSYVVLDEKIILILHTPDNIFVKTVVINNDYLISLISEFSNNIRKTYTDIKEVSQTLYRYLIDPVSTILKEQGVQALILDLDDNLRAIPFSALYDGKEWLIQEYAISRLSNTTLKTFVKNDVRGWKVAGMGVSREYKGYDSLAFVPEELDNIIKTDLNDNNGYFDGDILLNDEFTVESIKNAAASNYKIIHFATHFEINPYSESSSRLLIGDGSTLSLEDFRKGEFDFSNINLITLSACKTGESGIITTSHSVEVEGLGLTLHKNGAKSVLATLWSVYDRSTALFMREFYSLYSKNNIEKSFAIRKTQIKFITSDFNKSVRDMFGGNSQDNKSDNFKINYSHPYYWAPFILMGEWQ